MKLNLPIRTFRSLRHKNYALFWSSDLIASMGQFVREIALYWLVYEITGSAFALGILGLFEATPRLLLYPFIGVFIDRYDRLRLLIWTQFIISIPVIQYLNLTVAGIMIIWSV